MGISVEELTAIREAEAAQEAAEAAEREAAALAEYEEPTEEELATYGESAGAASAETSAVTETAEPEAEVAAEADEPEADESDAVAEAGQLRLAKRSRAATNVEVPPMAQKNHRMCVSCRQILHKDQLWRVVRVHPTSQVRLDTGMGRSAYLCQQANCIQSAHKKKRLNRALRTNVPDGIYAQLAAQNRRTDRLYCFYIKETVESLTKKLRLSPHKSLNKLCTLPIVLTRMCSHSFTVRIQAHTERISTARK